MADYFNFDDPNIRRWVFKFLTQGDLHNQFTAPTRILRDYPIFHGNSRDFTSTDRNGNRWGFRLVRRNFPQYDKPSFPRAEWHRFVVAKGLQKDDLVIFYELVNNPAAGIQVRALRNVTGTNYFRHVEALIA